MGGVPGGWARFRSVIARSIDGARRVAPSAGVSERDTFEGAPTECFPGRADGPRRLLRSPARHRRSGRCRASRATGAEARWHVDDRRALRQRSRRGQPQPGRSRVRLRFDARVRGGVALAGSRARARRAGRRSASERGRHARRLHARARRRSTSCSKRDRDPSWRSNARALTAVRARDPIGRGTRWRANPRTPAPAGKRVREPSSSPSAAALLRRPRLLRCA